MSARALPDVTLIGLYPPPGRSHEGASGVASYTANLARALAGRGAEVTVVAPDDGISPTRHRDGDVQVVRGFERGPGSMNAAAAAARATRSGVVHVQHETFLFGGPTALPGLFSGLGRLRHGRQRLVVTLHQVVAPHHVDRAFTRMHRVRLPPRLARAGIGAVQAGIGRIADRCIVHESSFVDTLPAARVVPHGVEDRATPTRALARAELQVDDSRFVVLCFGFVAPYKGLELALEAGRSAGHPVQVVVAGGEHPRMAGRDDYAAALAARHPEARFTGWVPEHHVAAWFGAADLALFCYPTPHASSGALALALAHGTPALVSPAMADCIDAPSEMTTAADALSLGRQLLALAADPRRRLQLGEAGCRLGRGRSWPSVADAHIRVYEEALACRRR